jgi:nucleolar MIF4G domain-containing protein 1
VTDDEEGFTGADDDDDDVDYGDHDDDDEEEEDEDLSDSDSAASNGDGDPSPSPTKSKTAPAQRRARENPYLPPLVAPRSNDTPTTTTAAYVPPARRSQGVQGEGAGGDNDDSARRRIRRQAQGLLNRLSEANLVSLLSEVEQLYRAHPRQQVTSTLTDILVGLVGDQAALSDSFLILHAGFVAALYKVIGMDVGAAVLHRVVERFDAKYAETSSNTDHAAAGGGGGGGDGDMGQTGREVFNLISLVAELYNIQVVGSVLVYDFIRLFLDKLTEINTELLMRIVKSGPFLLYLFLFVLFSLLIFPLFFV